MKRKWLIAGLLASLTLNLALVGFLIGTSSGPSMWRARGFDPSVGLARLVRFLPQERRDELLDDAKQREIRASLRDLRRAQRNLNKALAAEPFDRAAVEAALRQFRDQFADNQALSHAAFVAIAERLTPEERQRFVRSRQKGKKDRHESRP